MSDRVEGLKEKLWEYLNQEAMLAAEILELSEEEVAEVKSFIESHPYHEIAKKI